MKSTSKLILSLFLIIFFLVACGMVMSVGFVGAWMHTYKAFTKKTPVAEITISQQKKDEFGDYADVVYKPIKVESALSQFIAPKEADSDNFEKEHTFKLYGDTIHLGGPIIKFRDELVLLNFDSIYKIGKIFSRYNIDNEKELNKNETQIKNSSFDINGGIDENWKTVHENLTADNLKGQIIRLFVDTTQLDVPGQFVSNRDLTYTLYVTNSGFLWELK